ncbi:hypothetical protein HOLleu_05219 [Holothuria leucospilota]|uniref:Uncharacterized protein n=1 Tax=Holothuria leucospilota TaxID=206669 RepID=A0A9Q1CKF2_HOLLE|nr:hypothetical protein HOLleu_05219 [Holothuria leucospilota]
MVTGQKCLPGAAVIYCRFTEVVPPTSVEELKWVDDITKITLPETPVLNLGAKFREEVM